YASQQGIGIGSSFFHQMCAIGDTECRADWNVRLSVEEMPESVNERSCRSTTTRAQLIVDSGNDRARGSLSRDGPAQDSTLVHGPGTSPVLQQPVEAGPESFWV